MPDRSLPVVAVVALALVTGGCLGASGGGAMPTSTDDSPGTGPGTPMDGTDTDTPPTAPPGGTPQNDTSTPPGTPVSDYEALAFDHWDAGAPAIAGGLEYGEDTSTARYYATTVATAADAARFNHSVLRPDASDFVRNTSFADASLVVFQAFPASSHPNYHVESVRRAGDHLHVAVDDSSEGATADITVETALLRVPGDPPANVTVTTEDGTTVGSSTGVTTVTPEPTPTPEPTVSLPYTATDDAENVADPLDLVVRNGGDDTNGYRLTVTYHEEPECWTATPPCEQPARSVELLDRSNKLRPGADRRVTDLAARRGTYTVTVQAELPDRDGGRETVTRSVDLTLDDGADELAVTITDDGVSFANATA